MSESFDALLDVIKSLFNFHEVYLSLVLDCSDCSNCSDCSDCSSIENIPLSNILTPFAFV